MNSRLPSTPPPAGGSRRATWLAVLTVLAGTGLLGYLILDRLSAIEDRLTGIDSRVGEIDSEAATAAAAAAAAETRSAAALDRAIGAEESASEAARLRNAAEEARMLAESETAEAREAAAAALEEAESARAEAERIQRERQAELDRLERALGEIVDTQRTALGLVMNLGSDAIEFEFDRAELGPEERELLSRIAGVLLTSTGYSIYVYGHTDDVGTEAYNQTLSERCAASVRDYLVRAGVDPDIITTAGYGQSSPLEPGTTAEARARNRRVEIGIVDVMLDYRGEARFEP